MKKSTFIHLILGTVSGLLFSIGLCMCLIPEWNAFRTGVICTAMGSIALLIQAAVAFFRSGKKLHINWKLTGRILYGTFAALVLGVGMCLIMVWQLMLPGIAVGVAGIVLLLMLIPMCLGLK